jgi:CDP-diacylglycerol--serine O-phosphatidyltransferase
MDGMVPFRTLPRRRRLTTIHVLPTLVTAGNLVAGLLALAYLAQLDREAPLGDPLLVKAAWLVFVGMFCDAADGRIARLTRTASPFGAQLDSLADIVTFGVVPALLGKTVLDAAFPAVPGRALFALSVVYVVGAALRLARYNVEAGRPEGSHATRTFTGLPSPAAAGVVASMVLVHHELGARTLEWALFALLPLLGFLMISRLPYTHLLNRYLDGRRPLAVVIVLVLLVFLVVAFFEQTVAAAFVLYALSGVVLGLVLRLAGKDDWEGDEDDHLEADAEAEAADALEDRPPARGVS